jgi:exoribonuclease R
MDKKECIELLKKSKLIVGSLSTSQPIKFGKTKSGKAIYQIKAFKTIFPPFWITYGGRLEGKILIAFKFKEWKEEDKLPFAEIVEVLGLYDEKLLSKALLYHYEIDRKNFKGNMINLNEKNIIRKDLRKLFIFSIDPKGSIDIDDALSIEKIDNRVIVGVHIAQPICWLNKEEIIERSNSAFSTLYLEDKNKNLWSDEITMNASLFQDQDKPAYSIFFSFEDNKIINIESYPTLIKNKLNTNYDQIDFKQINELLEFTNILNKRTLDSHELVSHWMVEANKYIGNNFDNIPYRVQSNNNNNNFNEIANNQIKNIFQNMLLEGATYSYDKTFHKTLDVNKYTHFTSPIRRMIDTINHWNITYSDDPIVLDLDMLNKFDYKTKKFHRQMNLLAKINILPDEKDTEGWLYNKSENKWNVYFEELGFMKVKIWDKKLEYLKEINSDEYIIGQSYQFKIMKKVGFLPHQKILIILKTNQ